MCVDTWVAVSSRWATRGGGTRDPHCNSLTPTSAKALDGGCKLSTEKHCQRDVKCATKPKNVEK